MICPSQVETLISRSQSNLLVSINTNDCIVIVETTSRLVSNNLLYLEIESKSNLMIAPSYLVLIWNEMKFCFRNSCCY